MVKRAELLTLWVKTDGEEKGKEGRGGMGAGGFTETNRTEMERRKEGQLNYEEEKKRRYHYSLGYPTIYLQN